MKWKTKEKKAKKTERVVWRFLFFPGRCKDYTYWLEGAWLLQTRFRDPHGFWWWETSARFDDKEEAMQYKKDHNL